MTKYSEIVKQRESTAAVVAVDFETRSCADLAKVGAFKYAEHESTAVLVVALCWRETPDGELHRLCGTPDEILESFPARLFKNGAALWVAHNAQFEYAVWSRVLQEKHGFPVCPSPDWWCDSAAQAAVVGLPRALGQAAKLAGFNTGKLAEGAELLKRYSKPKGGNFNTPSDMDLESLKAYCMRDAELSLELHDKLPGLSEKETEIWLADFHAAVRGIPVNLSLIRAMTTKSKLLKEQANKIIGLLTDGAITSATQRAKVLTWLNANGCGAESLNKASVAELLNRPDLGERARGVLTAYQVAAATSLKKWDTALMMMCDDHTLKGQLMYHGAFTGRWSGRGVQPQNFPRTEIADPDLFIHRAISGADEVPDNVDELKRETDIVRGLLRFMVRPAGSDRLIVADYAQIEARVLLWLTSSPEVSIFRAGGDIYKDMAAHIFGVEAAAVTKEQRFVGKTAVLGLGYGMGASKFAQMIPDAPAGLAEKACKAYRAKYARVVGFWRELETAARFAIAEREQTSDHGITYDFADMTVAQYLICTLPSGRKIYYRNPAVEETDELSYESANGARLFLYGGLLAENICQSVARDVMAEAIPLVEELGFNMLFTVHDELVVRAEKCADPEQQTAQVRGVMERPPVWADGLPLAVEIHGGKHWEK